MLRQKKRRNKAQTMTFWSSLYLPCDDAPRVASTLRESLTALGYKLFDPFGIIPGKAYPKAVRLFVAPPAAGWIRVVGVPDSGQFATLSQIAPCLALALDGQQADIRVYVDGAESSVDALAPYLRAGRTVDDITHPLAAPDLHVTSREDVLPINALPDDVRSMAGNVDMKQAQNMFNRLAGTVSKRAGQNEDMASAARSLIAAGSPPDWNSAGGKRIRALVGVLSIPEGWQSPEFTVLRDAYQLHARRKRNPNADLYPGDAEALLAVPDALAYVPVYGGMEASI
jgi:hypothetical protein